MPCELNATTSLPRNKHHVLDVPKSLSAHDCLIGVTDEQLLINDDEGASSSSRALTGATKHLPPRNPTSRHHQSSNVKPRGWYTSRRAYRSVAYKTWTVGSARKLLNSQTDLESIPNGSVSDTDEKYYSAVESDFEDCPVSGCLSNDTSTGTQPRKCVSTEMFYDTTSRAHFPKESMNNNNNYIPNGSVPTIANCDHAYLNGYTSVKHNGRFDQPTLGPGNSISHNGRSNYPDPSPGCSDQEETDCYSSADYCRFNQKRNGFVKNRIVRSFDAVDSTMDVDDADYSNSSGNFDEEMRTVIDTFEDLRNLRKIKQEKIKLPRSKSPFANTSQAFVKKIQQVLPNLHSNVTKTCSSNSNDACKSPSGDTTVNANNNFDYYEKQTNNYNNNNQLFPDVSFGNYANYDFSNREDAMEYLKNELASIRQRDFLILNQLRQMEMEIQSKKLSNKDLARCATPLTVDSLSGSCYSTDLYNDDRILIPVPNCLLSNNFI